MKGLINPSSINFGQSASRIFITIYLPFTWILSCFHRDRDKLIKSVLWNESVQNLSENSWKEVSSFSYLLRKLHVGISAVTRLSPLKSLNSGTVFIKCLHCSCKSHCYFLVSQVWSNLCAFKKKKKNHAHESC